MSLRPSVPSLPSLWEPKQRIPSPAKPKPTGFMVSSQLAPGKRYRRNPGPANTEEKGAGFGQLRQRRPLTNICEWPEQGSLGLHCWGRRPSPGSVQVVRALTALSQAKAVGLVWLSPQQISVVIVPFSLEGLGSAGEGEIGDR